MNHRVFFDKLSTTLIFQRRAFLMGQGRILPQQKRATFCNAALFIIMDYLLIFHLAHTNVALVTLLSHFLASVEQLLSLRRVHLHY